MTELEALHQRHSVRAYEDKKIVPEAMAALRSLLDEVNAEGNLHLQLVEDAGKTFNRLLNRFMGLGSAPSVIACIGPDDETLDERIGYYGQKIVLAAQCLGLNTCWAGTFNPKNVNAEIGEGERLSIVIAIGYGAVQGNPHRSKKATDVSNCTETAPDWFRAGVEAALLSPTAINQQHFRIELQEDGSVRFTDLGGVFSKVDLGIVRYQFEIGAGRKV